MFYVFGVTRSGIEPRPPAPRADALTTVLRRGGKELVVTPVPTLGHGEVDVWGWNWVIHGSSCVASAKREKGSTLL